jgi:hypothetical protein
MTEEFSSTFRGEQLAPVVELPAAVLARTLGIDITVAVKWQRFDDSPAWLAR